MADAGARDRLVTIQQVADSSGESGFPVETWTTLATMYASRKELRTAVANEDMRPAGMLSARFETEWDLPYRADIDPEIVNVPKVRRLVYEGRVHDILHAQVIGRRRGVKVHIVSSMG